VLAATAAVAQAKQAGEPVPGVEARLGNVVAAGGQVFRSVVAAAATPSVGLSDQTADAIQDAVDQSTAMKPKDPLPPAPSGTPTPPSTAPANPGGGPGPAETTAPTSPPPTSPPATDPPESSTTVPPTTNAPTTTEPPPTSPTTDDTASSGSIGGGDVDRAGPGEQASGEQVPPTTLG
jgi:hypothetical protein